MKNITTSTLKEHKNTMNTIARTMGFIFTRSCKKKLNGIDQKLALAPMWHHVHCWIRLGSLVQVWAILVLEPKCTYKWSINNFQFLFMISSQISFFEKKKFGMCMNINIEIHKNARCNIYARLAMRWMLSMCQN
jgi:hypothetical protein